MECMDWKEETSISDLLAKSQLSQNVLGNLCIFSCLWCSTVFKSVKGLQKHTRIFHHCKAPSRNAVLTSRSKHLVAHRCKQCSARLFCEVQLLSKHFEGKHKLSLQEYCKRFKVELVSHHYKFCTKWQNIVESSKKTKSVENLCEFKCNICNKKYRSWLEANHHFKSSHKYTNQLINTVGSFVLSCLVTCTLFECQICKELLLCDKTFIADHVKQCHKFGGLSDYANKIGISLTKSPGARFQTNLGLQKILLTCKVSDEVGKLCEFRCQECPQAYHSVHNMKVHLKNVHNRSLDTEGVISECGVKVVAHRCLLCSKLVLSETTYLRNHFLGMHNLPTVRAYCELAECKIVSGPKVLDPLGLNLCKFKCVHCSATKGSWTGTYIHIKRHHQTVNNFNYKDCLTKAEYHQCHLCSKRILSDRYFILSHCKKSHGMTSLSEYTKKLVPSKISRLEGHFKNQATFVTKTSSAKKENENQQALSVKRRNKFERSIESGLKDCCVVLHDIMAASDSDADNI